MGLVISAWLLSVCLVANSLLSDLGIVNTKLWPVQLFSIPTGVGKMLDTQAGLAGNVSVLFILCPLEPLSCGQLYALTFFFFPSCWLSAVTVASPPICHISAADATPPPLDLPSRAFQIALSRAINNPSDTLILCLWPLVSSSTCPSK